MHGGTALAQVQERARQRESEGIICGEEWSKACQRLIFPRQRQHCSWMSGQWVSTLCFFPFLSLSSFRPFLKLHSIQMRKASSFQVFGDCNLHGHGWTARKQWFDGTRGGEEKWRSGTVVATCAAQHLPFVGRLGLRRMLGAGPDLCLGLDWHGWSHREIGWAFALFDTFFCLLFWVYSCNWSGCGRSQHLLYGKHKNCIFPDFSYHVKSSFLVGKIVTQGNVSFWL